MSRANTSNSHQIWHFPYEGLQLIKSNKNIVLFFVAKEWRKVYSIQLLWYFDIMTRNDWKLQNLIKIHDRKLNDKYFQWNNWIKYIANCWIILYLFVMEFIGNCNWYLWLLLSDIQEISALFLVTQKNQQKINSPFEKLSLLLWVIEDIVVKAQLLSITLIIFSTQ
jgi:hypothetical protein